jgi:hypothetical protein
MNLPLEHLKAITRRQFFGRAGMGVGAIALASMMAEDGRAMASQVIDEANPMLPRAPHFAPKAKAVIYLHMAGAPSQLD